MTTFNEDGTPVDETTGEIIQHTQQDLTAASQNQMLMPSVSAAELKESLGRWEDLKAAVLTEHDWQSSGTDKATGRERKFIKKSGWEKLAICFSVSSSVVGEPKIRYNADGNAISATVICRATAPNGRSAEGVGACAATEKRFRYEQGDGKMEHNLVASAETRARNRAYSNLFGHGEVSYEEVEGNDVAKELHPFIKDTRPGPPCPNDGRHTMIQATRKTDTKKGKKGSSYWRCNRKKDDGEWCNGYRDWEDGNEMLLDNPIPGAGRAQDAPAPPTPANDTPEPSEAQRAWLSSIKAAMKDLDPETRRTVLAEHGILNLNMLLDCNVSKLENICFALADAGAKKVTEDEPLPF